MRFRTLKAMNNLILMLMLHMGYLGIIIEDMDRKLLPIKIIEASKSIRKKALIWFSQISRVIGIILSFAHTGIKEWQHIEERHQYKQLYLKL